MKNKGIVFDMDGVIIDSEPIHLKCDKGALEAFGVKVTDQEMEEFVGVANPEMWTTLIERHQLNTTVEKIVAVQDQLKAQHFNKDNITVMPGLEELLDLLEEKGYRIGLASSSPRYFIEMVLENLNVKERFDGVLSGEEVEKGKPAPDVYLKAAEVIGVDPEKCMAVEDATAGVRAAKSAGMYTIGFQNPNSGNQDLSEADLIVTRHREIVEIIKSLD